MRRISCGNLLNSVNVEGSLGGFGGAGLRFGFRLHPFAALLGLKNMWSKEGWTFVG
jgi:hypothetical protein